MITEVCRFCGGANKKTLGVNPLTKEAITALADSFGHRHLVQTPILNRNVNHGEDVAAARAMLERNESSFMDELKNQFALADAQIDSLKIPLKDCECQASAS